MYTGYEFLVKNGTEIVDKIAKDPPSMALALRAKGFVSDEVVSEVNELNETSKSKAMRLYIEAKKDVRLYPYKYPVFMDILKRHDLQVERTKKRKMCKKLLCAASAIIIVAINVTIYFICPSYSLTLFYITYSSLQYIAASK